MSIRPANDLNFDLIDAAGYGYRKVIDERKYLYRLAMVPLFIKFVCTVLVFVFDQQTAFLRQGLIMVPALFAEGWMIAQFLRTILMHERWPIELPENTTDMKVIAPLYNRARGIMASMLCFTLIGLISFVFKAIFFSAIELNGMEAATEGTAEVSAESAAQSGMLLPALMLMVLSLWAFRLLWFHIPFSILMPAGDFLRRLGGFMTSVRMFSVWLVSITPLMVGALMVSSFLLSPYQGSLSSASPFISFGLIFFNSTIEMVVSLIATAAMAYALKDILKPQHPQAFKEYEGQGAL